MYDLACLAKRLTDSESAIQLVPYHDCYGQHFEDTPRRVPDLRKAARVLDYAPRVRLEDGLLRTIQWCREHRFVDGARDAMPAGSLER